jgi:flavin-dependent dehydrogenase
VRSEFDALMLENAREHGVEVHEGVRVHEVLFEGDRAVGVRIKDDAGFREVRARVVVDASGQNGLLMNKLRLRVWDPILNKGAIWTYWEGAYRDTGKDEGATMVLQTPDKQGWFWYIPQHDNIVSVGVVAPFDYLFKGRGKDFEKIYNEEVERTPAVKKRIKDATRVTGYFATKDYSYRTTRAAGDGWVLVGDSWGFIDPIYSSGVWFALKSGQLAADAIIEGLRTNNTSGEQLGKWVPDFAKGTAWVRKLAEAWHCGQFRVGKFIREYPHHVGPMTDILIGRIFHPDAGRIFDDLDPWLERMKAEGVTS